MHHGFIKVAVGTPEIRVGDCGFNANNVRQLIEIAAKAEARLLVLSELCLTGCTCADLFYQDTLLDYAEDALSSLITESVGHDMLVAVGLPIRFYGGLYNCAAFFQNGVLLGIVPQSYTRRTASKGTCRSSPSPKNIDEIRIGNYSALFGMKQLFCSRSMPELVLGIEVSEDANAALPPAADLALQGATIILNLSSSAQVVGMEAKRLQLLQSQSARLRCAYLYAEAGLGESTSDAVYSGHNIIAELGTVLAENKPFSCAPVIAISEVDCKRIAYERRRCAFYDGGSKETQYAKVSFDLEINKTPLTRIISSSPFISDDLSQRKIASEEILRIQAYGLKKRIEHTKCKTLVLGVSGGLDSTLALFVAIRASELSGLPLKDIIAVSMPCFGTTERTRLNAELLCKYLGVSVRTIDITSAAKQHFKDISHPYDSFDSVYENAQARERTQVLMDIANQTRGLVVGSSDLSELALGFTTYNGDHMSMYGVNASVPKTVIRSIIEYLAQNSKTPELRDVLLDILDTPVSPELLPQNGDLAQHTEELIGPYELHDFFIYHMLLGGASPEKVLRIACYAFLGKYSEAEIQHWLKLFCRRFFSQQFKRSCMPDSPAVSTLTLSSRTGWQMPSDASSNIWLEQLNKNQVQ